MKWLMPGLLVIVLVCAALYAIRSTARAEPTVTSVWTIRLQEHLEAGTVTLRRKDFDDLVESRNALYGAVIAYQLKGCR